MFFLLIKRLLRVNKKSPICIRDSTLIGCLHAESNYELILTMDPLYHLTMEASAFIINTYN